MVYAVESIPRRCASSIWQVPGAVTCLRTSQSPTHMWGLVRKLVFSLERMNKYIQLKYWSWSKICLISFFNSVSWLRTSFHSTLLTSRRVSLYLIKSWEHLHMEIWCLMSILAGCRPYIYFSTSYSTRWSRYYIPLMYCQFFNSCGLNLSSTYIIIFKLSQIVQSKIYFSIHMNRLLNLTCICLRPCHGMFAGWE